MDGEREREGEGKGWRRANSRSGSFYYEASPPPTPFPATARIAASYVPFRGLFSLGRESNHVRPPRISFLAVTLLLFDWFLRDGRRLRGNFWDLDFSGGGSRALMIRFILFFNWLGILNFWIFDRDFNFDSMERLVLWYLFADLDC